MTQELKIFIGDPQKVEEQIVSKGAELTEEVHVNDTYFNQPEGEVLKLTQNSQGNFLVKLKAQNGGFAFVSQERVEDVNQKGQELNSMFGIKCILKKIIRYFKFQDFQINILQIEDLGCFLIVEGETVTPDVVEQALGFTSPKYLTISFDKLQEQQENQVH